MSNCIKDAKEIYFYFLGSHQHMERENVYERYKMFNISKKLEEQWRQELIAEKCAQLPDVNVLSAFSTLHAYEAISTLIQFRNQGNGFFKCRLAETLFDIVYVTIVCQFPGNVDSLQNGYESAKNICEELLEHPDQKSPFILNGSNEIVNEEYIKLRARANLERFRELSIEPYK